METETHTKAVLTQSALGDFRNCRNKYRWRFIENLRAPITNVNYFFGGIIHDALEVWHATRNLDNALMVIDKSFNWQNDHSQNDARIMARAMMKHYASTYAEEQFKIVELEYPFTLDIKNPETSGVSQTYFIRGKADGLVIDDKGRYWLLEHKTASQVDGNYLERLWGDFQIAFYSYALERALDIEIFGVIYNILVKTKTKRKYGETDDEFTRRKAEVVGTSSAKQKANESDEDYAKRIDEACEKNRQTKLSKTEQKETESDEHYEARLLVWYQGKQLSVMRETIIMSRDRLQEIEEEVWEISKALLHARNRGHYYKNNAFCYFYNRQCAYFPLCAAGERWKNIADNLFEIKEPHQEVDTANKWLTKTTGGNYEFTAEGKIETETPTF